MTEQELRSLERKSSFSASAAVTDAWIALTFMKAVLPDVYFGVLSKKALESCDKAMSLRQEYVAAMHASLTVKQSPEQEAEDEARNREFNFEDMRTEERIAERMGL
jgi:hypothetical protein